MIFRYRKISTFGRDTIRRFAADASAMKKLAARDFEDLLMVCSSILPASFCVTLTSQITSAPFLSLKDYFLNHTTPSSWIFFLLFVNGMLWQNSGYTLIHLLLTFDLSFSCRKIQVWFTDEHFDGVRPTQGSKNSGSICSPIEENIDSHNMPEYTWIFTNIRRPVGLTSRGGCADSVWLQALSSRRVDFQVILPPNSPMASSTASKRSYDSFCLAITGRTSDTTQSSKKKRYDCPSRKSYKLKLFAKSSHSERHHNGVHRCWEVSRKRCRPIYITQCYTLPWHQSCPCYQWQCKHSSDLGRVSNFLYISGLVWLLWRALADISRHSKVYKDVFEVIPGFSDIVREFQKDQSQSSADAWTTLAAIVRPTFRNPLL